MGDTIDHNIGRYYGRPAMLVNLSLTLILAVIVFAIIKDTSLISFLNEFLLPFIIFGLSLISHIIIALIIRKLLADAKKNQTRIKNLDASWVFYNQFLVALLVPVSMKQYTTFLWVVSFHAVYTIILHQGISFKKKLSAVLLPIPALLFYWIICVFKGNPSIHILNVGFCALLTALLWGSFRLFLEHTTNEKLIEEKEKLSIKRFCAKYDLSDREQEVLSFLLAGYKTRDIGERLFISDATVRTHIINLFRKTGVHSRVELLAFFSSSRE